MGSVHPEGLLESRICHGSHERGACAILGNRNTWVMSGQCGQWVIGENLRGRLAFQCVVISSGPQSPTSLGMNLAALLSVIPGLRVSYCPHPHGDCEHTSEDYRWDGDERHARRNLCVCATGILARTEAGVHLHQAVSPAYWCRHHSPRGMNLSQRHDLVWDPSKSPARMVLQPDMCESI